jgi:N-acetylglucosaminyl-diphospho-decaprenol L-rhamnosyltransferase
MRVCRLLMSSSFIRSSGAPASAAIGRLVVSIVTFRAAQLTIDCLRSIAPEICTVPGCRVIVIDNASGDGSDARIEAAIQQNSWGDWARLVRAPGNGGFSAGNNVAIREMLASERGEYVLLLNPDTLVRPGAFRILVDFMDQHPEVGITGGRSEDLDATPQQCCFRFPSLIGETATYLGFGPFDWIMRPWLTRLPIPSEPQQVDWVSGAMMLVRREVFADVGLMDEGYFLYYEETDFALRAARAGWACWHVPQSRIVHFVGQSTGVTRKDAAPRRRPAYWFESRRRYLILNHGRAYAAAVDACVVVAMAFGRLRAFVERRPRGMPPAFFRDFVRHSALLNGLPGPMPNTGTSGLSVASR